MPRNETPEDLKNEQLFADKMKALRGWNLGKLSEVKYIVDFAIYDEFNNVHGFIEFKRRKCDSNKYEEVFCAINKWLKLKELSKYGAASFYVQYNDKLLYLDVWTNNETEYELKWAGRTDRDNPVDMEPLLLLTLSDFTEV